MGKLYPLKTILHHFWNHHRHETTPFLVVVRLFQWTLLWRNGIKSFFSLKLYRPENKPGNILTNRAYSRIQRNLTPFYYQCLLEDKLVFDRYMKSFGFPVADMIGVLENGRILWLDPLRKENIEEITGYQLDCFFKILTKWGGVNVHRLEVSPAGMFINKQPASIETLKRMVSDGMYVLQRTVVQHPELSRFNTSSVNTVRMITIHDGVTVRNLANFIRMGVNNSMVDNISQGGIGCGIQADGTLMKEGFDGLIRIDRHPDSGLIFAGCAIPHYANALELVRNMHQAFHCFFLIGWDIAFTETGPVVIEGNPVGELLYEQHFFPYIKESFMECAASYRKNRDAFVREFVLKDKNKW